MHKRLLITCVLCVTALCTATAQEQVIRLPGEVRFASQEGLYDSIFNKRLHLTDKPPAGVKLPSWLGKERRFAVIEMGKPKQSWHVVIDLGGNRAVVDTNSNNDLADDLVLIGVPHSRWLGFIVFTPIRLNVSIDGTLNSRYISINITADRKALLMSEDYRTFSGQVAGQEVKLSVIDADLDGAFGSPSTTPYSGDRIIKSPDGREAPLPRFIKIGGTLYRLTVLPDGSACELQPAAINNGTVHINYPTASLQLSGQQVGHIDAETTDGKLVLPEDDYTVSAYAVTTTDEQGIPWRLEVSTNDQLKITVRSGDTVTLQLPKELLIWLSFGTRIQADNIDASLMVAPADSLRQLVVSITRQGEQPPPPRLRLVDSKGRTIKVETFHYG